MTVHLVPADQTALHRRYRPRRPRLFLIRPDGHIGYSGAPEDLSGLRSYLDRLYVPSPTDESAAPRR